MQIITDSAVAPFAMAPSEIQQVLLEIGAVQHFPLLMAINEIADSGESVKFELVPVLEYLRTRVRRLPDNEVRRRFVDFTVWPCAAAYRHHLLHLGEFPRFQEVVDGGD